MNLITNIGTCLRAARAALPTVMILFAAFGSSGQTATSDAPYAVVDRGPFYRVLQRTVSVTDSVTGQMSQQVQSYTELEDGMHYLSNGVWAAAQDVIEVTPNGAQALYGQMTAQFNSDITTAGAISLTTMAGEVFQSHPIGLFYADSASGKIAQIGSVQPSSGTFYPPNIIVFSNVLSGISADLMLVWAKNGYEQNLILKQNPPAPAAFSLSSSSTTLQFWSSMDSCPPPKEQRPVVLSSGLEDHILIFGSSWFPVGAAFAFGNAPLPSADQAASIRVMQPSEPNTVPVAKSLVNIEGQQILIEEVRFSDLAPSLSQLPQASISPADHPAVEFAQRASFIQHSPRPASTRRPMEIASSQYIPKGVVLDYMNLSGGATSFTFSNNATYHITGNFSVGSGTATFQQNACLKYQTNVYVLAYGPVSCPAGPGALPAILTSRDDNSYGAIITNSTANPGYAASDALWMYFQTSAYTLQSLLVRWAQTGIRYDINTSANQPLLYYSALQDSTTGIYLNIGTNTLTVTGDTYCNVANPVVDASDGPPRMLGTIAFDCGVVSVAMVNDPNRDSTGLDANKNSQSECSFVLPDGSTVVAAFWNTHLSEWGLGAEAFYFPQISSPRSVSWAKSINSGGSFTDMGPIPPASPSPTQGDVGDPVMAYAAGVGGQNGTIYLLVNPSREPGNQNGFRLWTSTDKGATFSLLNNNVPNNANVITADKPMILAHGSDLYVSGKSFGSTTIWAAHSGNGGSTWDSFQTLDTVYPSNGSDIAIVNGTVYVFWLQGSGSGPYVNKLRYAWLPSGGSWSTSLDFGITLNSTGLFGTGQLLRSKSAASSDYFDSNGFPRIAVANGRIYVAYADLPYAGSTTDRGDIWLAEALIKSDHSLTFNGVRKVNNDGTTTDQWDPSIAANPSGTELFIGYYSRQNDQNNSLIMAYGAKANIGMGLVNATFDCFPVSPTAFKPLFAGTSQPALGGWAYDPVWSQSGVCLDSAARYTGVGTCSNFTTDPTYITFCADDYTWVGTDNSFFYFSWCDRSRTFGITPNVRPDADVNFAKIKQ